MSGDATPTPIPDPRQCPTPASDCGDCRRRGTPRWAIRDGVRWEYDPAPCWRIREYERRVTASGLARKCAAIECPRLMSGGVEPCKAKGGGCPYGQTWGVTTARPAQVKIYRGLARWDFQGARGLYLHGGGGPENPHGVGTGKTRGLRCMINAALDSGLAAEIVRSVDLFARLRATYKDGSEESDGELLARWARVDVLAVDDLGSEHSTPTGRAWAADRLLRIIDARDDAGRPTLWASNYTVGEVCQRWGGADGARILSRISGGTFVAELGGPDNRVAPQTPGREKA